MTNRDFIKSCSKLRIYEKHVLVVLVHSVKSARIRRFSSQYFPPFGLNTKIYSVFKFRIQSKLGKIQISGGFISKI